MQGHCPKGCGFMSVGFHLNRSSEPMGSFPRQYFSRLLFAIPLKKYFLLIYLSLLPNLLCAAGEHKRNEAREKHRDLENRLVCGDAAAALPYLEVCNGEEASARSVCPLIRELGLWGGIFHLGIPVGVGAHITAPATEQPQCSGLAHKPPVFETVYASADNL